MSINLYLGSAHYDLPQAQASSHYSIADNSNNAPRVYFFTGTVVFNPRRLYAGAQYALVLYAGTKNVPVWKYDSPPRCLIIFFSWDCDPLLRKPAVVPEVEAL